MFPIKDLITFGLASVAMIAVTGGPWNLRENLRNAQIQMIREVGKTSNWGDPLIWHTRPGLKSGKREKAVGASPRTVFSKTNAKSEH